jgi:hypothetical protein
VAFVLDTDKSDVGEGVNGKVAQWKSGCSSAGESIKEALELQNSEAGTALRCTPTLEKMEEAEFRQHMEVVLEESRREQAAAEERLAALRELFPEVVAAAGPGGGEML